MLIGMIPKSPCTGEYDPSSSSMEKTTIQVHTTDKSSEKPLIVQLYEPELTPGLLASYSHIHIQIFGEIINNLGK